MFLFLLRTVCVMQVALPPPTLHQCLAWPHLPENGHETNVIDSLIEDNELNDQV